MAKSKAASSAAEGEGCLDHGRAAVRRLGRRDSEEKAARAIAKNCKYLPKTVLEHSQVNGKLMRDRVRDDLRTLEPGKRLGPKYWAGLIAEYTADASGAHALVPEQEEQVSDELLDALAKLLDDNPAQRSNRDLIVYLRTAPSFNQTEWIGMAKVMSDARVERLRNHDELMMEWMKFAARTKAKEKFPNEIAACRALFDRALAKHWHALRKSNVKLSTFLSLHVDQCSLLMDRTDLLAVVASRDDMASVRKQLARLYDSSGCGVAMFAEHMKQFAAKDFSEQIQGIVHKTCSNEAEINDEAIETYKSECKTVVQSNANTKTLQGKRSIDIEFFGCTLSMVVSSLTEEVDMRLAAAIKNIAIGRPGGLEALSYEKWIKPLTKVKTLSIPKSLIEGPEAARRLVSEIIADDRIASFAEVEQTIKAQSSSALVLDPTFRLELSFLSQAERLIGECVQRAILERLPGTSPEASPTTMEHTSVRLAELQKSDMVRRSSCSAIGQLESVQLVIDNMMRGISPEVNANASSFFVSVLDRCARFFEFDNGKTTIKGKEGIQEYSKTLEAKFAQGTVVSVPEIERLRPFWWLLSKDQVVQIESMLDRAIKSASEQGRSSGASAGSHKSESKLGSAKRKRTGGDDNAAKKASLLKLFRS